MTIRGDALIIGRVETPGLTRRVVLRKLTRSAHSTTYLVSIQENSTGKLEDWLSVSGVRALNWNEAVQSARYFLQVLGLNYEP